MKTWNSIAILVSFMLVACGLQTPTGVSAPTPSLSVEVSVTSTPSPIPLTTTPEPPATAEPTLTPAATIAALPTTMLGSVAEALGEDCSRVERLAPDSPEALRIVRLLETRRRELLRADPFIFQGLYDVTRLEDYVVVRGVFGEHGLVVAGVEERDTVTPLASVFLFTSETTFSRFAIHDFFVDTVPNAPPALFGCLGDDFPTMAFLTENDPPEIINPQADCSAIETLDPKSQAVQDYADALLEAPQEPSLRRPLTSRVIESATRRGDWTFIQVILTAEDGVKRSAVYATALVRAGEGIVYVEASPMPSRRLFARDVYANFPDIPADLLSCSEPIITRDPGAVDLFPYYAFGILPLSSR